VASQDATAHYPWIRQVAAAMPEPGTNCTARTTEDSGRTGMVEELGGENQGALGERRKRRER